MAGKQPDSGIGGVSDIRQREIYITGVSGTKPDLPLSPAELEEQARRKLSARAFAYVAGGAGAERTIARNRRGFDQFPILPRMLRDVSALDTRTSLFGRQLPTPLLLAPVGVLELAHPEADLAVARAAASLRTPMIFSNQASRTMEACAAQMDNSPRWFQLYWSKSDALVQSFLRRAERCGCEAIVITLDTTMLGWRERDLKQAYLPFLEGHGIAQYVSDPVFQNLPVPPAADAPGAKRRITLQTLRSIIGLMRRHPGGFFENLRSGRALDSVRKFINIYSRPSLNWEDLERVRDYTKLPVLLKGILHPEDARRAVATGMDGLIVSNHGGRQVDGAVSSVEMLPEIVEAVAGKVPVLLDSGIRNGADVFKALALGATAVCIGRPYVYALALGGEAGVREYLRNLTADFERTMGLAGCPDIASISRQSLRTATPAPDPD